MPPSAHWGKRPRSGDSEEAFVRFSELSPAAKMERRREERGEKKERERTLAYFKSVQRALEEHGSGGGDAGALASIVDGFFSELLKLLKADSTFYVLRNGTACRVIELALTSALLLHVKSLLYVFLGHICDLMVSPVASFTLETLLAALSQGLSALGETNPEGLVAELTEGGVGTHVGSGVPSSATLVRSMADELCERAEDLIVHDIGGRALRSVVMMLGGRAIRQAPQPPHPVAFPDVLGTLAEAIMKALEDGYGREYNTANAAESWMAAVQAPATSLVVQSLLRVSDEGSVVDRCVRQRIEALSYKGKPLLHHLLVDPLGCHVFQSYVQVPPPAAVVEAGDMAAARATAAASPSVSSAAKASANEASTAEEFKGKEEGELLVPGGADSCCWSRAAELVLLEVDNLLKPGSDLVAQTGYVLQDLVLYAPATLHLQWLWRRLLSPRLLLLFDVPALTAVLVQAVKRCAFEGVLLRPTGLAAQLRDAAGSDAVSTATAAAEAQNEVSHHGTVLPADVLSMLRKEAALHVRYSPVPIAFQSAVCARVCELAKQRAAKGAAQYLLVDGALSEKGHEVARYLMHLHPSASKLLQHSLDKLQREDLVAVVCHQKGSQFMQQYIKVAALATPTSAATAGDNAGDAKGPLMRLFRRLQSSLSTLIYDKYAAFMVETLYECASLGVKEALVKALVPIYQDMRKLSPSAGVAGAPAASEDGVEHAPQEPATAEEGEAAGNAEVASPSPTQQRFIAYKVMSRCCVEQYVHRKEDWTKLALRQCQVQQLLRRMLLSE
ncbi:hypothetical protein ABB37_06308 [Leptomonas pyrrhocoris]|uniref:Uncharacterized protein n=1 Tax=Leptomonas pyrrhocoris TaxID=157538 RepID=A0A0M9FXR1_LEPPY|nr:hypothetical protein ABB37_06308 [Leptomonas pyrrhocoris]KPA78123.1 hypothetical protein ABB37_06308 [Leptomonas pyrrhocoris]|eukprot:XP_015656562.1 hypothetical protein ABB37_06308 [Leptomonas pyrrhocoris]